MGDLVKGVVEPLARRWTAAVGGAVVLLWLVGALIYVHQRGAPGRWCDADRIASAPCTVAHANTAGPVLLAVAAVGAVVASAALVAALSGPVLEVLAGRWGASRPAVWWARKRVASHRRQRDALFVAGRAALTASTPPDPVLDAQRAWGGTRRLARWRHFPRATAALRPTGSATHCRLCANASRSRTAGNSSSAGLCSARLSTLGCATGSPRPPLR